MQNPFRYGCIVTGNDFCDRPQLVSQLSEHINSGQNVVMYGERRVGKSSLAKQTILTSKGVRPVFIDFMGIKTTDALIKRILRAIVLAEKKRTLSASILKKFASVRPALSLDPVTSMPTVSFDASVNMTADSIGESINLIQALYDGKKVAIVMDEFQDILDLKDSHEALAIFRSNIQHQPQIPYVFIGSIRHKMAGIFMDNKSPFFKSAIPLEVGRINPDEFSIFIKKKFKAGKRTIEDNTIKKILEIAFEIPGDVQQLCEALWAVTQTKQKINTSTITPALELIFSREKNAYENYVRIITALQYKSLVSIARLGGKSIFSIAFLKPAGINNPSSLKRAVNRLIDLSILFKYKDEYRFVNPFFRAWLLYKE
jgi:AAA+ ATPase superfamily predicted ATPase